MLSGIKEATDFGRSIKCWQLLDADYLKWSDCKPKLHASKAAGRVAPVWYYEVSGSAWQKLAVIPAAVTPAVAVDFPLMWDLWVAIQYTDLFWPLFCANLKILTTIIAGGWGQSSTWLKGRLCQIAEDRLKVGGVGSLLAYKINALVTVWW